MFAFGSNLSPTNLLTLCKNDVVHNQKCTIIDNSAKAEKEKLKTTAVMCAVRVLYGGMCNSMCECILQKINTGKRCWQLSRKGKLSTLLSQGILCSDQWAN